MRSNFSTKTLRLLPYSLMIFAEVAQAQARPPTSQTPTQSQLQQLLASHPQPPDTTPNPWVDFTVERAMGAECHRTGHAESGRYYEEECAGTPPSHLVKVFLQIPDSHLAVTMQERKGLIREALYRAAPGLGDRPDFTVHFGDSIVRSLESPTPGATTYLVMGPVCETGTDEGAKYCRPPFGFRAYRLTPGGTLDDVTDQVLPDAPTLSLADRRMQEEHGRENLSLLVDKLEQSPTLRWVLEIDDHTPLKNSHPLRISGGRYAHFGFLTWNGQRMELVERVDKKYWPCEPVEESSAPCSGYMDLLGDRFVIQPSSPTK